MLVFAIVLLVGQIASLSIPDIKSAPTTPTTSPTVPKTGLSNVVGSSGPASSIGGIMPPVKSGLAKPIEAESNAFSIHGQNVTAICFDAYRSTFIKTLAVTDIVQALVQSTSTIPALRVPGMAAAQAAQAAQSTFTKVNENLDSALTDEDRAALISARNEEVSVSVFIGLVINNVQLLNAAQRAVLDKFHVVAQAERVSRLLVQQSCPELDEVIMSSRR